MEQRAEPRAQDCPPPCLLRSWLDGLVKLDKMQVDHILGCDACAHALDQISDAPDMQYQRDEQRDIANYENEREYRELKIRFAQLGHSKPVAPVNVQRRLSSDR